MVQPGNFVEADHFTNIGQSRIETTELTASSAATSGTTELLVATVDAVLTAGITYRITFAGATTVSVTTDHFFARIRENSIAGAQLQGRRFTNGTAASAYPLNMQVEYPANASGLKTFVVTFVRSSGTGTATCYAAADQPGYLYVDSIRET